MTYNIANGVAIDDIPDYQRTANIIKKDTPDIIRVQEIGSMTKVWHRNFFLIYKVYWV